MPRHARRCVALQAESRVIVGSHKAEATRSATSKLIVYATQFSAKVWDLRAECLGCCGQLHELEPNVVIIHVHDPDVDICPCAVFFYNGKGALLLGHKGTQLLVILQEYAKTAATHVRDNSKPTSVFILQVCVFAQFQALESAPLLLLLCLAVVTSALFYVVVRHGGHDRQKAPLTPE